MKNIIAKIKGFKPFFKQKPKVDAFIRINQGKLQICLELSLQEDIREQLGGLKTEVLNYLQTIKKANTNESI